MTPTRTGMGWMIICTKYIFSHQNSRSCETSRLLSWQSVSPCSIPPFFFFNCVPLLPFSCLFIKYIIHSVQGIHSQANGNLSDQFSQNYCTFHTESADHQCGYRLCCYRYGRNILPFPSHETLSCSAADLSATRYFRILSVITLYLDPVTCSSCCLLLINTTQQQFNEFLFIYFMSVSNVK